MRGFSFGAQAVADRIRGRRLQARRARFFADNPLCVECRKRGVVRVWTQLDHIIALDNGGLDVESNLQGLCDECHTIKTAKDLGHVLTSGADASGLPQRAEHHWNR